MPHWIYIPTPASSGWLPSDLSNLWGWYKADAITGKSDGDSVGTWSDESGNSRTMTLSTGGTGTYKTNILDGKAVVRLTAGSYSNGNVIDNSCCISIAAVLNRSSATDGGNTSFLSGSDGTSTNRSFLYGRLSGDTLLAISYGSTTYDYRPSHTWNHTDWKLFCSRSDHGNGTFRLSINGTETNDVTGLGTGNLVSTATTTYIGAGAGVNQMFGDYAEVVLYDAALSEANLEKLEGYLAHKWGLEGDLPSGHPYKNSAP